MELLIERNGSRQLIIDWIHAVASQYDFTQDDFEMLVYLHNSLLDVSERLAIAQVYIQKLETNQKSHWWNSN